MSSSFSMRNAFFLAMIRRGSVEGLQAGMSVGCHKPLGQFTVFYDDLIEKYAKRTENAYRFV